MQYNGGLIANTRNAWKPMPLVIAVGVGIGLVVVGSCLGLGLGIGLHNDSGNLTVITTTIATTTLINSTYRGTLTNSSESYGGVNQSSLDYYYEAIDMLVSTTGSYTLQNIGTSNVAFYGYLYNNSFDVINPLTNLIARTDQTNNKSSQFTITSSLVYGVEFVLVVTTANQSATGTFNITASGPGSVTFVRRIPFSLSVLYGTTLNDGTDAGTNGSVQINADDVITGVDGASASAYVQLVSFSFFTAPSTTTPTIWLYVMNQTGSTLTFTPNVIYQIPYASITTGVTGTQSISVPIDVLPVVSGQYIGVGFDTGGGSLNTVANQASYVFDSVTSFSSLTTATYTTQTDGFAFSFELYIAAIVFG